MSKFQDYLPIYDGDRYCLMCSQACPVRRVTKSEVTSPHGWALLVASVNRGLLEWNDETVDILYQCADCGMCQGNCATDRPLPAALMAARAEVVRLGKMPASVSQLDEKLRTWGNPYGDGNENSEVGSRSSAVALFVGTVDRVRPQSVAAAQKLLRNNVSLICRGRSSGYLPYSLGLWDTARMLGEQTLDEIKTRDVQQIIALSAQDAHAIKNVYPELGLTLPEGVLIVELVEYLAQKIEKGELKIRARDLGIFTYHDATHTSRLTGRAAAARELVRAVTGSAPREMLFREQLATPTGTAGGLEFTQPALAHELARTRISEAQSTGAGILLTDDPLDTAQLEQASDGMQVLNVIELLSQQLIEL